MGDFQYFDIILFALIAGFLVLRLRSVLGRRTGNERRRDSFIGRPEPVSEKIGSGREPGTGTTIAAIGGNAIGGVGQGLERIRRADSGFDPAGFVEGARVAFEMIVTAFAKGDKAGLRPLLSDEVYGRFAAAIDERMAAREKLETSLVRFGSIDIAEAELSGQTARVTVKLVSEQINVTRAMDGSIVEGDPEHPIERTDFWTFARDVRSTDPNWLLAATSSD